MWSGDDCDPMDNSLRYDLIHSDRIRSQNIGDQNVRTDKNTVSSSSDQLRPDP